MNYNSLMNKPTINYRELIGDNTVTEVGGITEEQFNTLLNTDLSSYYTKAQIDDLFSRSFVYREKSGSIVTFDCPTTTNGISEVTSEIVAVQSGTGDPSPQNIRPITGWSAVNVYISPTTLSSDGTTYTTTLKDGQGNPMTCYGGELSNVNGVQRLKNEYGYAEFDGSNDENWRSYSGSRFTIALTNYLSPSSSVVSDISANYLKTVNKGAQGENLWLISGSDPNTTDIMINIGKTTVAEVREYLAENPLQVKYKLNTPQTIPQDNLAIASSAGINNIWCDSGDITVKALDRIIQG